MQIFELMFSQTGVWDKVASNLNKISIEFESNCGQSLSHLLIMSTQKGSAEWYESLIARYKPEDGASTRRFISPFNWLKCDV